MSIDELKRMPLSRLEAVIGAIDFTKKEIDWVWEKKRGAFEVF